MDILVSYNGNMVVRTSNATAIPRKEDIMQIGALSFRVAEVVWHMDNRTWVEIRVER